MHAVRVSCSIGSNYMVRLFRVLKTKILLLLCLIDIVWYMDAKVVSFYAYLLTATIYYYYLF